MKIEIFEGKACCGGSCACQPKTLTRILDQVDLNDITINRYDPINHPLAFSDNVEVYDLIDEKGLFVLPITMVDNKVFKTNSYPTVEELKGLTQAK